MHVDEPHAGRFERIKRPLLESRLAGATSARVALLIGPAGCGKGDVLRGLRDSPSTLYYRAGKNRRTLARFVYGLAQAVAPVAPGAMASFPRTWERALQSRSPVTVLARWLTEHLSGTNYHIAIDDLHESSADPGIAAFLASLAELRPDAPLTIAAHSAGSLPVALWMATGRMDRPIDETEMRFDRDETAAVAARFGVALDAAEIEVLLGETGGYPVVVTYALTRLRWRRLDCLGKSAPGSFTELAERIFRRRTESERAFLFTAALLTQFDSDLLAMCGWNDAQALRKSMLPDALFIWEENERDRFVMFDRFRAFIAEQFKLRDPAFRSTVAIQAVRSLTLAGSFADALELATDHQLLETMGELLDAHGFEILEAGQIDVISEALTAFTQSDRTLGPVGLALRGYMEARLGRLDTAEAWFRLGLDAAKDEAAQVTIATYYARELTLRRREDAFEVLKPFADSTTLVRSVPRSVYLDVGSSYAQALTAADRLDEARRRTDEAVALLDEDSPPALRARVLARAAYVALETGAIELARERATVAAPLAVAQSLYDVAASTYSVLYNIAYEFDDDVISSIDYLHRMRDLSAKSGTLRLDIYVMLALFELHAEAGDEVALAELDCQLSSVDKHDATSEIMETLLPGKALRAGWAGHFNDAQRLLRPSADRQATPTKIALRWAEIALYCAAAHDPGAAASACGKSCDALRSCDAATTQHALTLLTLALAEIVGGDLESARKWACSADNVILGAAPRCRALRACVEVLIAEWDDPERLARNLPDTLARLRSVQFGGMAKLIEALPYRAIQTPDHKGTICGALAMRELSAAFAATLETGDVGALYARLDTMSGSAFEDMSLSERFETWLRDRDELDARACAVIADTRPRLATYRRSDPKRLRHIDDIDTAIEVLFEHLDIVAPLMGEHSRAVSAWCGRLARLLSLSEDEIAFVTRCGLIHDIGKMNTPADILGAPRQLTPEEWAVMRDHAADGGRIVSEVPLLRPFAPIVRAHHERLDGKGYPDGLKAGAIPLAARIVAVADSFNAMIGRRPYRLPLAPTDALHELTRHRGTQFDPEIVEAMERVVLGRLTPAPSV